MNLYLVRHGDAVSDMTDPTRPLSEHGRQEIQQLARGLAGRVHARRILHSGKTRARETAEILHRTALPEAAVTPRDGLNPNDDVAAFAAELTHETEDRMIVGHLPYLSLLASALTSADSERTTYLFGTGTCLALRRHGERWLVAWMLDPTLLD